MKAGFLKVSIRKTLGVAALAIAVAFATGCKQQATAPTDQQIATNIQAKIHGESALTGQNIQVSVAGGVATLSGTVPDPASRALAGNDAGTVAGVKTVVNNLSVQPAQTEAASAPPAQARPKDRPAPRSSPARQQDRRAREQAAPTPPAPNDQPQQAMAAPEPAPPPPAPPEPPKPVVKEVTLAAGTVIPVRISGTLSSEDAQPNDVFHAALASDLGSQGVIALRQGAAVLGRVVDARNAAHFKGTSLLSLELTQIMANGRKITLVTAPYNKEGAARGKNTVEKAAGGAILGTIIGAIAGGGKGAAVGAAAGGAAGTGVNAVTRGQQVTIPPETLINFRLKSPITVNVTSPPQENPGSNQFPEPQLQHR